MTLASVGGKNKTRESKNVAYSKTTAGLTGLLASIVLLVPMLIPILVHEAAAQTADKRIFRGGAEAPARAVERGVTVVRGQATIRPTTAPAKQPARLAAGSSLWLIDEAGERLIGCELQETGFAGRQVIECASGDLPDIERD